MADINCAVDCKDGCVLGDKCPHKDAQEEASSFISNTSLDDMLAMAEAAVQRKRAEEAARRETEGPKWVFPEGGIDPDA